MAKRSLISTLQFIGLDLTTRAIAEYARFFEWTSDEFQNTVKNIIGNYCSENTTVISLSQLAKNLLVKFENGQLEYKLPEFSHSSLFPPSLSKIGDVKEVKMQEFLYTVKLFRAFCSWGGNSDDLRLMLPFLKNPYVMSFVIQQMDNKSLNWNQRDGTITLKKDEKTIQVVCEDNICRKQKPVEFYKKFPYSIGKISLSDDLARLYCQELTEAEYKFDNQEKRVKKWIMQQTIEEENILISHFLSLLTGVPDLIVRSQNFNDLQAYLKASLDWEWDQWAKLANTGYTTDLLFEESVSLERVESKDFFRPNQFKFQILFDVNLGEFDRMDKGIGKLNVQFELKFSQKFLKWLRNEWINRDFDLTTKNERFLEILKINLKDQIQQVQKKFIIPPWKGNIEEIIRDELLWQLSHYVGKELDHVTDETISIPVIFRYGPFALKYFYYRFRSHHGTSEIDL